MSYNLDGSVSNSRVIFDSGVTGTSLPLSISCWCFCTNGLDSAVAEGTNMNMVSVMNSAKTHWNSLLFATASINQLNARIRAGSVTVANPTPSTATASATGLVNKWVHAAGVFASETSRFCTVNGTKSSVQTARRSTTGIVDLVVGATAASLTRSFQGYLAEVGIWNIALKDDDINALYRGAKPTAVQPDYLVHYVPFVQNTNDIVFGQSPKTVQGATPLSDHPARYG